MPTLSAQNTEFYKFSLSKKLILNEYKSVFSKSTYWLIFPNASNLLTIMQHTKAHF